MNLMRPLRMKLTESLRELEDPLKARLEREKLLMMNLMQPLVMKQTEPLR